ncbi:MAG: DUF6259 domain-containing protein [Chloroflexi bacterium]|nr:DUF6259 domain-containing protein [Chloroflexota bacterium]
MEIRQQHNSLFIDAPNYTARWDGATLVSVVAKQDGSEFCRPGSSYPLELYYVHEDSLAADKHQQVEVRLLSSLAARIILLGADSIRELLICLDPANGDMRVIPSGQSARRGVASIRWNVAFDAEASLVLPCVNGLRVSKAYQAPRSNRFAWPFTWNAQLAIAERGRSALMIHAQDTAFKFKALKLGHDAEYTTLGFESEQVGPLWDNRTAGGTEWRVNVYPGNWQVPAARYRNWLAKTYDLADKRAARPAWVNEVSLNIMWADTDTALLDRLAEVYPPREVLIHLASWRTSAYDVDYPDYYPTGEARAFMAKAQALGYHVMPHFNYFSCYNDHPLYIQLRDWQIRSAMRNEPQGWYWPPDTHDYTRMGYIHPGLGLWRRTLIDTLRRTCASLQAQAAFIDQTLCTWNTDNGLVENMSTIEGLRWLQEEFSAVQPDIVLAGEGCNEISFQRECFAQAHIYDTPHVGGLMPEHAAISVPICSYLWRGHTQLLGYYHLHPNDEDMELGIEVYRALEVMPTLGPGHFTGKGNPLDDARVRLVLERAHTWRQDWI